MRLKTYTATLLFLISAWNAPAQIYTISTFAGGGIPENIPGTSASLGHTLGVAVDKSGNVFFSNTEYFIVERWDATTGLLTVVAGNGTQGFGGDGSAATGAQLYAGGIAVDSAGNLYIADHTNNRIRKVSSGVITTIAGNGTSGFIGDNGPATAAELSGPNAIAVDSAGNLYIADTDNNLIRKVSNGVITTVAGTGTAGFSGDGGPAASAQLNTPDGVAVDTAGNLYIADLDNQRVRKVSNGTIATVAGTGTSGFSGDGGPAIGAQLYHPWAVAVDQAGNLYIADADNNRVREVSNGVISTIAGTGSTGSTADGVATSVRLSSPQGVAVDAAGNVYISDTSNLRIRKLSNGVLTTIAGGPIGDNGPATSADLNKPEGVALDSASNVYITDYLNDRIRRISNGIITTVAGNGTFAFRGDGGPATSAELGGPGAAVALDSAGNLYIPDYGDGRVREVSNGVIATVAGGGSSVGDNIPATSASVTPSAVAVDSAGNLYIGDGTRVRKVSNGIITTVAGNGTTGDSGDGGPATSAALSSTSSLIVDSAGNLYIDDAISQRIREVSNGIITTVAGSGHSSPLGDDGLATSAGLALSYGIALDRGGNLYIADTFHDRIRKVSNGVITTIAGNGTSGFSGDGGPATSAEFLSPTTVAVDSAGNVYIADSGNNRIRLLTPGPAPAVTPGGVVPVDSTISVIQPGSWISIYGSNLASGTSVWNGDFPTSLGGVSVAIDGKPAYLWFVSPGQINLQVPDDTTTGAVAVVVNTPFGSATSTVTLAPYGPSLLLQSDGKHVLAIVATPGSPGNSGAGYDIIGPSRPVKAGEVLVLFGVGFGPTTPAVTAGQVVTGAAATNSPVTVAIGSAQANAVFAGIVEAGMYQINVIVPSNTGGGDQALVAGVNGVTTPAGPVVSLP